MSLFQHSLEVFVTHIEGVGPLLRLWVQIDRTQATFVERLILQLAETFERGLGIPNRIHVGTLCCARYNDGVYYRARVTDVSEVAMEEKISVQFIDYGNSEKVRVRDIRLLDGEGITNPLATVPEQATDFFLVGVFPFDGAWNESSLSIVRQLIHYEEVKCVLAGQLSDKKLLRVFLNNEDLSDILIARQVCASVTISKQQNVIENYFKLAPPPTPPPIYFNVPPPGHPPPQRLLMNVPQTLPLSSLSTVRANQQMTVPVPVETVKIFTSPKLEEHSEHMVYVSFVEDGPLSFAVQLQDAVETLSSIMNEINHLPLVSPTQPLMPGSVCLGRFTEDQSLCRAVVMAVLDDKCKLYYVDFGNSEILPYTEIYELPQRFINPKVMALRFALSGLKNIAITEELKSYFKEIVTDKEELRLRVVPPEGPPLKQYGELFLNNMNILQFLINKAKEIESRPTFYSGISPQNGYRDTVKISYVVNVSNFYVQLESNSEALNSVMLAVDATCSGTAEGLELDQLKIGMPCCALYSEDGKWYRSKVLSISANAIEVMYVDYGNTASVPLSSLRYIKPELVNILNAQAISCSLKGFQENVDDELAVEFEQMTLEKTLTMVVVDNLAATSLVIELYDGTSGSYKDIGAHLLARTSLSETHGTQNLQHNMESEMTNSGKIKLKAWWKNQRCHLDAIKKRNHIKEALGLKMTEIKKMKEAMLEIEHGQIGIIIIGDKMMEINPDETGEGEMKDETGEAEMKDGTNRGKMMLQMMERNPQKENGEVKMKDERSLGKVILQLLMEILKRNLGVEMMMKMEAIEEVVIGILMAMEDMEGRKMIVMIQVLRKNGITTMMMDSVEEKNLIMEMMDFRKNGKTMIVMEVRRKGGMMMGRETNGEMAMIRREVDLAMAPINGAGMMKTQGDKSHGDTSAETWNTTTEQGAGDWDDTTVVTTCDSVVAFPKASVKIGDAVIANVVYQINPEEFCVQLTEVMDGIAATYGSGGGNPISSTDLKPGTPCVARYSEDDTVYRAVIQSVADNDASVFFCDYGNTEIVPLTDIKEISAEYLKLPVQGIMCKLLAVKPQENSWSDEEISRFSTYTDDKDLRIQFVNKQAELYEVILEDTEATLNVNEKFGATKEEIQAALSIASTKPVKSYSSDIVTTYPLAGLNDRFTTETPIPGTSEEVIITWFISPEQFYCQKLSSKFEMSKMMTLIQSTYCGRESIISSIDVGSPVIAKYKVDGVLYRAEVKDITNPSSFVVQFVDYGNLEIMEKNSLWDIEKRFMDLPKQAIVCSLDGIKSTNSEWARGDEGVDKFFEVEKFQCTFLKSENDVQFVSLVSAEQNVADLLVSNGFAVSKTEEAAPIETEPIPLNLLPGQILPAYVTYIEGISNFFIQLNVPLAEKIQSEIGIYVQNSENMVPIGSDSVSVNSLCIASPDGEQWYRARIIDCTSTTGVFVKFIDFGDGDEIPLDKVLDIPTALAQYADQALECCISGSSDNAVTPELQEEFKSMVEATNVMLKIYSVEDNSVCLFNSVGKKPDLLKDIGPEEEMEPLQPLPVLSESMTVWVSHVDGPTSLWLQRISDSELLAQLLEDIYQFYEIDGKGEMFNGSVGSLCAAKSVNDEQWYRGRVISLNSEDGFFKIQFVDYGNTENLPESNVMNLDASLYTPYVQALCATLPVENQEKENIASTLIDMTSDKEFIAKFAYKFENKWMVDLYENGKSLCNTLLELELIEKLPNYPFPPEEEVECLVSTASTNTPAANETIFISHVNSPSSFWIQFQKNSSEIEEMEERLLQGITFPELNTVVEGSLCAATYSDELWYRAKILKQTVESYEVLFIDYGNTAMTADVKALPEDLLTISPLAKHCSLLPPPTVRWSEKAKDKLIEKAADGSMPFTIDILDEGDPAIVSLYEDGNKIEIELAKVCDENNTHAYEDNEKIEECQDNSKIKESVCENSSEDYADSNKQDGDIHYDSDKINEEAKEYEGSNKIEESVSDYEEPTKMTLPSENIYVISSQKQNAIVCHVNSLCDFWIQFEESVSLLNSISDQLADSDNFPVLENYDVDTLCVARFPSDGNWYRAKIINNSDEGTEVVYVDFGNTSLAEEFRRLPDNLEQVPPNAKRCALSLPDNITDWPETAQAIFTEIVGDVSKMFEIEIVKDDDPAVISMYDSGERIEEILIKNSENFVGTKDEQKENVDYVSEQINNTEAKLEENIRFDETRNNEIVGEIEYIPQIDSESIDTNIDNFDDIDDTLHDINKDNCIKTPKTDETNDIHSKNIENDEVEIADNEKISMGDSGTYKTEYIPQIDSENIDTNTENFDDIDDTLHDINKDNCIETPNTDETNAIHNKNETKVENVENIEVENNEKISMGDSGMHETGHIPQTDSENIDTNTENLDDIHDTLHDINKNNCIETPNTDETNAIHSKIETEADIVNIDEVENADNENISMGNSGMHEAEEKSYMEDGKGIVGGVSEIEVNDVENGQFKTDDTGSSEANIHAIESQSKNVTINDEEVNVQKIEHTVKLVKELNVEMKTPENESAGKLPLSPKKQISERLIPAAVSCGISNEDMQSPLLLSSPKTSHAEKIVPGCISRGELCESGNNNVTQSAPSTPLFSRSQKLSKSVSSHELLRNTNSLSNLRLPHSERIVPGCISRGDSTEEIMISPQKLPHSEKIVPGSVSRGSSNEDVPSQQDQQ
ncbi:hypothetical protein C0J52_03669 [Blattella germanica]|nr:hypothetical protein C0J52_03669 [Blattella germanica]